MRDRGLQRPLDVTSATETSSTGLSPRIAAPLAYAGWWVTGAVLWFVERRDRRVRFHAAQSVAAFGIVAFLVVAFGVLALASLSLLPAAFSLFLWAAVLTWVGGVMLWIVALWRAATGHTWRIPVAADLADRIV
jgi:uncharacterized membrane protein